METQLMFLDCPAYLDRGGSQRAGFPPISGASSSWNQPTGRWTAP